MNYFFQEVFFQENFFWEDICFCWEKFKKISFYELARPEVSEQILDIWPNLLVCHYHLAATHQAFIFSLYYMPHSAHLICTQEDQYQWQFYS